MEDFRTGDLNEGELSRGKDIVFLSCSQLNYV